MSSRLAATAIALTSDLCHASSAFKIEVELLDGYVVTVKVRHSVFVAAGEQLRALQTLAELKDEGVDNGAGAQK